MPELFQEMYYGPNVQNLVESDDCKVMRLSDNSGEGMILSCLSRCVSHV